jgi:predicted DNA-binding transcriptional regulator YafY
MQFIINTIQQAAKEKKILKIIYYEKDGSCDGWRYIEPYSFTHDSGEKGLFAWDKSKGGIRRFSLSRIQEAVITDENFHPRYPIEI